MSDDIETARRLMDGLGTEERKEEMVAIERLSAERDDFHDYLFEYRFDGAWWGITIKARSELEAKQRLSALAWARYRGQIFSTIHVPCGGLISKAINWLRG